MQLSIVCLLISIGIHACTLTKLTSAQAADPNDPVVQAVDTVTAALFDEVQPAVNAAVATLPAEAQQLAQAAFVALEKAVGVATDAGLERVVEGSDLDSALDVIRQLILVSRALHEVIHEQAPATVQQPNILIVPPAPLVTAP